MNEASKLISDSLLGIDFKVATIKGRAYRLYPPTMKTICRALGEWSKVGIDAEYSKVSILAEIPGNYKHILNGLLWIISRGNSIKYLWLKLRVNPTSKEMAELSDMIINHLMGGDDFFACAALVKQATQIAAKQQ